MFGAYPRYILDHSQSYSNKEIQEMPDSLEGRLNPEGNIPITDCPNCKRQNVPVGFNSAYMWPMPYCLNCHTELPRDFTIVGYVSQRDLEEMEWDTEV